MKLRLLFVLLSLLLASVIAEVRAADNTSYPSLVIVIDSADYYPYYYRENGKLVGPMPEVTRVVLSGMGYRSEFLQVPWARAIDLVERRQVDGITGVFYREERETFLHYPEQFPAESLLSLIVPADSELTFNGHLKQLEGHDIGAVLGWSYGLFREPTNIGRIDFSDERVLVRNVALGRIGIGVGNPASLQRYASEQGLQDKFRLLEPPVERTPLYTAFSKRPGHLELARRFSEALETFRHTSHFQQILRRHGIEQ